MGSLAELPELVGFFSYSREDDQAYKGRLSILREVIQEELAAQLGRSKPNFRIFQDKSAIAPGSLWEADIKNAVQQSAFFIPIITPRAINSKYCRFEFEAFLEREHALGRSNLVFPIIYVPVPALANEAQWRGHPVLSVIGERQYVDWQTFRYTDVPTPAMLQEIGSFCRKVVDVLYEPWVSPEERKREEEAEAHARAEEERRRAAEVERRAVEEARKAKEQAEAERIARVRQEQEAEAARVAELRRREEAEAARIEKEKRRQQEADAERQTQAKLARERAELVARERADEESRKGKAGQQRAFAAAKAAGTVKMVDAFLTTYPESHFAEEAKALRAHLIERDDAYNQAMSSDDAAVLKAFVNRYPAGKLTNQVRQRLLRLEPSPSRAARIWLVVIGVILCLMVLAAIVSYSTSNF